MYLNRWLAAGVLAVALISAAGYADAPKPAPTQLATVEQLKTEALQAMRDGQFNRGNSLLVKAASMADDPRLSQKAAWSTQFEKQLQTFASQRNAAYQKAVDNVQLLLRHKKDDYAVDVASRAFLLADDKTRFDNEEWVKQLVAGAIDRAQQDEQREHWIKALRLYSDLAALQPSTARWKDQLKGITRRIRLLATYAPERLKALQQADSKERAEVDALLHPTTRPATAAAATRPTTEADDAFHSDWHESLKGINTDMLRETLVDAERNYWRPIGYREMLLGGINALRMVATTKGLETAFPNLNDAGRKTDFLGDLNRSADEIRQAKSADDPTMVRDALDQIKAANAATIQLPEEVWVSEFADGALEGLDPFSNMIWPTDIEEFNKTTQGEFSGVGIQIQLDKDGGLRVVSPLEDTPAFKAGIQAGDVITRINGKSAHGITLNQAVQTITGPEGSIVTLTVRHANGTTADYPIRRQTIKIASIKGWRHLSGGGWDYYVDPENKIAYIRITSFSRTTAEDLDKAVDQLRAQGARGLILDLRSNPGGLLSAATDVCDKFLTKGVIVSTRPDRDDSPNMRTQISARNDGDEFTAPMVVLVNQYSASAAEIVSGALKDDHRALIVGERTFGKGSVQMLFPLDGRRAYLKLTTSHYYLPNGQSIHREENSTVWGVDPDVSIELTPEQMTAAIEARQKLDVLHDQPEKSATEVAASAKALQTDPQLSAALLLLRMEN